MAEITGIADITPSKSTRIRSKELQTTQPIEKKYLGLLTTYNVPWDNEKTARDVWQNFFDGQGGTLDGVSFSQKRTKDGIEVSLNGSGEYDYSHLMHMGGGTKSLEGSSAGGYREGAKVAALIMLTRMGAKQVVHESKDWRFTYYLDEVPDYKSDGKPAMGLFAKVEKVPLQAGSRFKVKFPDAKTAKKFIEARNLFYSSDNPDFKDPIYNNPQVGGFKLHKGEKGNVYEAGQRRHFIEESPFTTKEKDAGEYYAVPDITLWTRGKVFSADRDRGAVTETQIKGRMIEALVNGMSTDEIRKVILDHPEFWYGRKRPAVAGGPESIKPEDIDDNTYPEENPPQGDALSDYVNRFGQEIRAMIYEGTIPGELLGEMIKKYTSAYKGETFNFPTQYVANSVKTANYFSALESAGYIICHPSMKDLGMVTTDEAVEKLMEHFKVKPSETESVRINLLHEFVRDIMGVADPPPIWMFNSAREKSFFHGHYTPEFLWVSQEQIHREFSTALRTYLHEITHRNIGGHNSDFVREFGLLYNAAMLKLEDSITNPTSESSQRVRQILGKWSETKSSLEEAAPKNPYEY